MGATWIDRRWRPALRAAGMGLGAALAAWSPAGLEAQDAGVAIAAARAQATVPADSARSGAPWAAPVAERVVALLARELEAMPEDVVVEWGVYRGPAVHEAETVELLGRGAGGHWVARALLPSGETASLRLRGGRIVRRAVAARPVERGARLRAEDVAMEERVVWGPPTEPPSEVREGWIAHRALRTGDELTTPAVRPPLLVRTGAPVEIRWRSAGVQVTAPGLAAQSGGAGARVAVRTEGGRRLVGIVRAEGVVEVGAAARAPIGGFER